MKLQNLTVIFVIVIIPVILLVSLYITNGLKTIKYQAIYDSGLLTATHDAIYAFELNTTNDAYSDNAETKRNILKSSVKAFERSLCNTCGISSYNTKEIEEYIPAIMFGMYDGFYMYAPSLKSNGTYEHSLKNYVYYSEEINGIIIRYSLDSYITVSGDFGDGYETKEGYLMVLEGSVATGNKYKNIAIHSDDNDDSAIKYYQEAYKFTTWFNDKVLAKIDANYFKIDTNNDPEDENSAFTKHKREVMKNKIEQVLNSTITAYSNRTTNTTVYKMPKLNVYDWEKIYSNISMVTFFQGKNIGLTNYNGYCVLNSTNSNEYVNPNLMYFINEGTYHDIRCTDMERISTSSKGYRIGAFQKTKTETTNADGETTYSYIYKHDENACYNCINGQISSNASVYDYVRETATKNEIKSSYFTSLARERYNTVKLLETEKDEETITKEFNVEWNGPENKRPATYTINIKQNGEDYRTYEYENSVSQVTLKLPKNANKKIITYNFEANAGEKWTPNISGNTITFTYKIQNKAYMVKIVCDDNHNLYGKRPTQITINVSNDNYSTKKTISCREMVTVQFKLPEEKLDDPYTFEIQPSTIWGYTISPPERIDNQITIRLSCYLEVQYWERRGKNINGIYDGVIIQQLKVGDYINYSNKKLQFITHVPGVSSRDIDAIIDVNIESVENWRVIGTESGKLIITTCSDNMPYISLWQEDGYNNGKRVIDAIVKHYADNEIAYNARQITAHDIDNICNAYGIKIDYKKRNMEMPDNIRFDSKGISKSEVPVYSSIDSNLSSLLFPNSYWIDNKFDKNGNKGYYNSAVWTDQSTGEQVACLYCSYLTNWTGWRGYKIRPVVYLKSNLKFENTGTLDGNNIYSIKN